MNTCVNESGREDVDWLSCRAGGEGFVDVVKEDMKTTGVTGEEAKNESASYLKRYFTQKVNPFATHP